MKYVQVLGILTLLLGIYWRICNATQMSDDRNFQKHTDHCEMKLNEIKQIYDDKIHQLFDILEKQETRYNDLQHQLTMLTKEMHSGPSRERRLLGSQMPQQSKVAFYAELTTDKTALGDYQTIEFDSVTTNTGNAYNKADGMFTAPVQGTYVFSWTAANHDRSHMWSQLVVNGVMKGKTLSDSADHDDIAVASNTVIVNLQAGDVVSIRSMTSHTHTLMGSRLSTFSGWLI